MFIIVLRSLVKDFLPEVRIKTKFEKQLKKNSTFKRSQNYNKVKEQKQKKLQPKPSKRSQVKLWNVHKP